MKQLQLKLQCFVAINDSNLQFLDAKKMQEWFKNYQEMFFKIFPKYYMQTKCSFHAILGPQIDEIDINQDNNMKYTVIMINFYDNYIEVYEYK